MKLTRKIFAMALVLAMVLAMATTAFAATGTVLTTTGTIKIENAAVGATYKLYRLFNIESTDGANKNTFVMNAAYADFADTEDAKEYFSVENGYVNWTAGTVADDSDDAKAFAAAAANYLSSKTADYTVAADSTTEEVTVQYGYYIMVSDRALTGGATRAYSAGVVNNSVAKVLDEKNDSYPTIAKSADDSIVSIGDPVTYTITLNAASGTDVYTIIDNMNDGITLDTTVAPVVKFGTTIWTNGTEYTLDATEFSAGHIKITLADTARASLADGATITVTYQASLNNSAEIAGTGNVNTVTLYYGQDGTDDDTLGDSTKTDTETVYTYQVTVNKVEKDTTTVLPNAEFVLYYTDSSNVDHYAKVSNEILTGWTTDAADASAKLTTDSTGTIVIKGLGDGTYYLKETKAPTGYQLLSTDTKVEITDSNATVKVENVPGIDLPETGGIGTVIFYTIGGLLVLAAVVLLVTKKRVGTK